MDEPREIVEELRVALDAIEMKISWQEFPVAALEEFKVTIDSVRTSLLALANAGSAAAYHGALRRFHLRRAAQVCHAVLSGLVDGIISTSTPGFSRLSGEVSETLEEVERLVSRSV